MHSDNVVFVLFLGLAKLQERQDAKSSGSKIAERSKIVPCLKPSYLGNGIRSCLHYYSKLQKNNVPDGVLFLNEGTIDDSYNHVFTN